MFFCTFAENFIDIAGIFLIKHIIAHGQHSNQR